LVRWVVQAATEIVELHGAGLGTLPRSSETPTSNFTLKSELVARCFAMDRAPGRWVTGWSGKPVDLTGRADDALETGNSETWWEPARERAKRWRGAAISVGGTLMVTPDVRGVATVERPCGQEVRGRLFPEPGDGVGRSGQDLSAGALGGVLNVCCRLGGVAVVHDNGLRDLILQVNK
jgi:hypothetical protein